MPRSSNSRLVGTIRQSSSMPTSITTRIRQYREEAAASPRLSDDAKLAVKRHREDRANASMASCASHDDSNHPPSEVLGNFEVSDFSKNFVVIRILPKLRHTQKVVLYGKIEKSNFHNLSKIGVLSETSVTIKRDSKNDAECRGQKRFSSHRDPFREDLYVFVIFVFCIVRFL